MENDGNDGIFREMSVCENNMFSYGVIQFDIEPDAFRTSSE